MKALIDPRSDRVAQIVDDGNEFAVATPLFWVDASDDVTTQWSYRDGAFSPPESPTEEQVDRRRFTELREKILSDLAAGGAAVTAERAEFQGLRAKLER